MSQTTGPEMAALLNEHRDGWCTANGLHFVSVSGEEVVAEWTVGPAHLQAYGIVHGGVHCGVIETLASVGAAVHAMGQGRGAVGLENHTTFVRAVREGQHLRAVARPLTRGSRTQAWEATITGDDGKVVATGRVRLLCVEPGSGLGER